MGWLEFYFALDLIFKAAIAAFMYFTIERIDSLEKTIKDDTIKRP